MKNPHRARVGMSVDCQAHKREFCFGDMDCRVISMNVQMKEHWNSWLWEEMSRIVILLGILTWTVVCLSQVPSFLLSYLLSFSSQHEHSMGHWFVCELHVCWYVQHSNEKGAQHEKIGGIWETQDKGKKWRKPSLKVSKRNEESCLGLHTEVFWASRIVFGFNLKKIKN